MIGCGVAMAAAAATLTLNLGAASARGDPVTPGPPQLRIEYTYRQPVAGHVFAGLTIILSPSDSYPSIHRVECDAKLAGKRLHARQRSFFAGPRQRDRVVCRWRIPAGAAGKPLSLWNYGKANDPQAPVVHVYPDATISGNPALLPPEPWIVGR